MNINATIQSFISKKSITFLSTAVIALSSINTICLAEGLTGSLVDTVHISSTQSINTILKGGVDEFQAGDTTEAQRLFKEALKMDPNNEIAHFNLGVIAEQSGDLSAALDNYQTALKICPHDPELQAAVSEMNAKLRTNNSYCENQPGHIGAAAPNISSNIPGSNSNIIVNKNPYDGSYQTIPHCPVCSMASYNPCAYWNSPASTQPWLYSQPQNNQYYNYQSPNSQYPPVVNPPTSNNSSASNSLVKSELKHVLHSALHYW